MSARLDAAVAGWLALPETLRAVVLSDVAEHAETYDVIAYRMADAETDKPGAAAEALRRRDATRVAVGLLAAAGDFAPLDKPRAAVELLGAAGADETGTGTHTEESMTDTNNGAAP